MRRSPPESRIVLAAGLTLAACVGVRAAPVQTSGDPGSMALRVHALETATYYFRAKDGSVLTLLTLELLNVGNRTAPAAANGAPTYIAAVSIEESDRRGEALPGATTRKVPLEIAPGVAREGTACFSGQAYLQSGRRYLVRYMVDDVARDEIFLKSSVLVVPYLSGGFSASSVVPAAGFGPAGTRIDGFEVGSEEVVPKAGGVFRRSERLNLYLQVYDAKTSPETLATRVDLVYRFYRTVNGSSKRYGKPATVRGVAGASMGLEFPIGDWPPGRYRVVVELHDRVSDGRTTSEGTFSIVDG
jgi:hypothetical protein